MKSNLYYYIILHISFILSKYSVISYIHLFSVLTKDKCKVGFSKYIYGYDLNKKIMNKVKNQNGEKCLRENKPTQEKTKADSFDVNN